MLQAFAKDKANDRKHWIENVHGETYVDYDVDLMKYSEFFNKEFVLFSQASVTRAIPALMDGFKPSQRKVLFACFKRNLKNEIKVGWLAPSAQKRTLLGIREQVLGVHKVWCFLCFFFRWLNWQALCLSMPSTITVKLL